MFKLLGRWKNHYWKKDILYSQWPNSSRKSKNVTSLGKGSLLAIDLDKQGSLLRSWKNVLTVSLSLCKVIITGAMCRRRARIARKSRSRFLSSYMFLFLMHVWKSSSIRDGCISIFLKCIQSTSQILVLNFCSESRTVGILILILARNNFLLNYNSFFSVFS